MKGLGNKVQQIRDSVLGNVDLSRLSGIPNTAEPNLSQPSQLSGSQQAARASQPAALSQLILQSKPMEPIASQPNYSSQPTGDPWKQVAALKQEVVELRQAVVELAEIAGNDIHHLSQARQQDEDAASPWGWILGGVVVVGLAVYAATQEDDPEEVQDAPYRVRGPKGKWMAGHASQKPVTRSSGALPKLADRFLGKLADGLVGRGIKAVF